MYTRAVPDKGDLFLACCTRKSNEFKGFTLKQVCLVVCMCVAAGIKGQPARVISQTYKKYRLKILPAIAERTHRKPLRFSWDHSSSTFGALSNFR